MPKRQMRKPIQVRLASGRQFGVKRSVQQAIKSEFRMSKAGQPIRQRRIRSGMTGLAPFATQRMRPMTMTSGRRNDGAVCRIHGTDFFQAVTSGAANVAGDILISQVVNPATLGVSRLATMSTLYERYKFRSLKFRYDPIANATVSGQLIGYVDYDTQDDPTGLAGVQNLQRAAAHYGEKPVQVWQGSEKPVFWEIKDVDPLTDLYVDSDGTDPRWTNQGRFVLLAASALPANTPLGNIYLDYDIEFYIPQIELTPVNGAGAKIIGGGVMSQANYLGTTGEIQQWSNVPITRVLNVITIPAGRYLITYWHKGTVLSPNASTTATTTIDTEGTVNAAATAGGGWYQVSSSTPFTFTLAGTATTVTESIFFVNLLPSNALTLTNKKLDRLTRYLELSGGIAELKASIDMKRKEVKQEAKKEMRVAHAADPDVEFTTPPQGVYRITDTNCLRADSEYTMVRKK